MRGDFYYGGVSAESFGIRIIGLHGSDDVMPVFGGQSVTEQTAVSNDYSTFIKTKKNNIKFTLTFSLLSGCYSPESITPERLREIGGFFARSVPEEFRIGEDNSKVINVVPVSGIEIIRFGEFKGYFEITFQAATPYWLTAPETFIFDLSGGGTFEIDNRSNVQNHNGTYDVCPYIKIETRASGVFSLTDLSDERQIVVANLQNGEVVEMRNKQIIALLDDNVFPKWNKEIFVLHKGVNSFRVDSPCRITVKVQYPII